MSNNEDLWIPSHPFPPPSDPCKDNREERLYDMALANPNRCYGKGEHVDPFVVWFDNPNQYKREFVWANTNFAKAIARGFGCSHAWIIKAAHDTQYARDEEGRKILIGTNPDRWLVKDADMHITLRIGSSLDECRLAAHAYVVLDEGGNPHTYATELVRRYKTARDDHDKLALWIWKNGRKRTLPPRTLGLGPGWKAYANVGPYLDTYRPDRRRTCDTYTPRSATTPPRDHTAYDDIIEGAMTTEMRALIKRCHAAYDDYQDLREELLAMDKPPNDRLIELHAMQEQIAMMQRDVYREAMGFIV